MTQSHLRIDGVTAGNTEDLKVCVVTVTLSHLQRQTERGD